MASVSRELVSPIAPVDQDLGVHSLDDGVDEPGADVGADRVGSVRERDGDIHLDVKGLKDGSGLGFLGGDQLKSDPHVGVTSVVRTPMLDCFGHVIAVIAANAMTVGLKWLVGGLRHAIVGVHREFATAWFGAAHDPIMPEPVVAS